MRFLFLFFLIVGVILLLSSKPLEVQTKKLYGIDVSHHQGVIDWSRVKTWDSHKIEFAYIKATEGATWSDKTYNANLKGAKAAGIPVGSYHYFRTTSSPEAQFANFIAHVDKSKQDLIPLIDLEERAHWDSDTYHRNLRIFLNLVEDHFGKKPMIYTVNSFYNANLSFKYTSYHMLIGRYGSNEPLMIDGSGWSIWQFTESARINGIPKAVDIDVTNGKITMKDLLLF